MKKSSKYLIAFTSVSLLCGVTPFLVNQTKNDKPVLEAKAVGDIHISSWEELKSAVKSASDGSTIVIDANITSSGSGSDRIVIDGKNNLTIDTNGCFIDRNRETSTKNGHAFEIQGYSTVYLINSSNKESNIIRGYADNGGAINIHDGSSLTVNNVHFRGNNAGIDGGAIFNRGTLIMSNCYLENNHAEDTGGAIYCADKSRFELDNVVFRDNIADDDGGAINAHIKQDSIIRNSTFTNNQSYHEDGGAICLHAGGKILSIYNTEFSENECEDYGGAIEINDGTVKTYGVTFDSNTADYGGAIYSHSDSKFEVCEYSKATEFTDNYAGEKGGALYNDNGDVTINGATFSKNRSVVSGGALYLNGDDNEMEISNATISDNESSEDGGGIYFDDGKLFLKDCSITDNFAVREGGGIFFNDDGDKLSIQGTITINNNGASHGGDLYIEDNDDKITISGSLDGSTIGVELEEETGVFTSGYSTYCSEIAPSSYFYTADGYAIELNNNEVRIVENSSSEEDPYLRVPFVQGQDVKQHSLNGSNWMAGISGDRYLNEINIPGTHDTCMKRVGVDAGSGSFTHWGERYAITQKRYVPEQFEGGVRYIDIRMNNRVAEQRWYRSNPVSDDGEHLWVCHGKKGGGTYWASDKNDKLIHVGMVLDWAREFLEKNPSECIIMGFNPELYYEKYEPLVWERLGKILYDYNKEYPGIFYLEGGSIANEYTYMPQLKEVRGKILLEPDSGNKGIGGFWDYGKLSNISSLKKCADYLQYWDERCAEVNTFLKTNDFNLPKDGSVWENQGKMIKIGLNCAPQYSWKPHLPDGTPLYHSENLFDTLFYKKSGSFYDIKGKYVGWVKTDGATEQEWGRIWRSNFIQDETDYCTITVDPNLNDDNYQIKQYIVLKNTTITIPYFNYNFDEKTNNKYFNGWNDGTSNYYSGNLVTITENTTFTADWLLEEPTFTSYSISAVWQDCGDTSKRPDEVGVNINNGLSMITLTENGGWQANYQGTIFGISPVATGIITGVDTPSTYRYEISGNPGGNYVIKFISTPDTTKSISVSGTITWDDNNNYDKARAISGIQVGLAAYDKNGDQYFIEESLVTPTVDPNNSNVWNYEIKDASVPKYQDGMEVEYKPAIKVSSETWLCSEQYEFTQDGNNFVACHATSNNVVSVDVRFVRDKKNPSDLPEGLRVKIYGHVDGDANNYELSTNTLTNSEDGWSALYMVPLYKEEETYVSVGNRTEFNSYSIVVTDLSGNPVEGYQTPVITNTKNAFDVLFKQEGLDISDVEAVIAEIDNLGEPAYTKAYKASLDKAREDYEKLPEDEKALVTNINLLNSLEDEYKTTFAQLIAIDEEIENACNSIMNASSYVQSMDDNLNHVGNAILALNEEDRNSLWNLDLYNETLLYSATMSNVLQKIEDIGEVTLDNDCKARIDAAKAAYEALPQEQQAKVGNYDELALAEAKYFALYFLDQTGTICSSGGESADHSEALSGIWSTLNTAWNELSDDAKAILNNGGLEDADVSIANFYARYSHIVNRYGNTYAFSGGPVVQSVGNRFDGYNINAGDGLIILVTILSVSSVITLTGICLFKRKRR